MVTLLDRAGQCNLGACYEAGKGVAEQDLNEAVRLYRLR